MRKNIKNIVFVFILLTCFVTCVEPYEIDNITFQENLVVKAILTDEVKHHSIELSQTIPLDSINVDPINNASIYVTDDTGIVYDFQEIEAGIYNSVSAFAAQQTKSYILHIEKNGIKYTSTPEELPSVSEIENVNFNIESNDLGDMELVIKTDSQGTNNEGNYYRYEYDETFKIAPPIWSQVKISVISDVYPYEFEVVQKEEAVDGLGFCYRDQISNSILITETKTLSEDRVSNFLIKSIPLNSYLIGLRYSILLKQYVINNNTYNYYSTLSNLSDPNSIFTQVQLGNIPSNIKAEENNSNNQVIGFFEVSSVSTKRSFISREEITEDNTYNNYNDLAYCESRPLPEITDQNGDSPLLRLLNNGFIFLAFSPEGPPEPNRPYVLIEKNCGSCSELGSVNPPDFWIE